MDKPTVIIGHGLAGCILGLTFFKHHIPFQQWGSSIPGESSMASSGLVNPITGRRYVKAWDIDQYMTSSLAFYRWTEELFGDVYFKEVEIVRFLSNDEAMHAWEGRQKDSAYAGYISKNKYDFLDHLKRPYGIVTGAYRLDTPAWLMAARNFLMNKGFLHYTTQPYISSGGGHKVIYATGAIDEIGSHGIVPNKGEALLVRMPGWRIPLIVKDEIYIVPIEDDLYWVGSYYERWPEDPLPSSKGREELLKALRQLYDGELTVEDHLSGIRPTVLDRRPIIGRHPKHESAYLFNGMGTKTTSLAPYWAEQLRLHLVEGVSLPGEVSPSRY